ncbi:MAG: MBL fold metallo-hydrolase [Deltaproteobacteria bacterium]|nr:MBL fold metallo-hydrolase [Deltaproteobacteria bacterium]
MPIRARTTLFYLLFAVAIIAGLIIALLTFIEMAPVFGGEATGEYKEQLLNSPNYDGNKFQNLDKKPMVLVKGKVRSLWEFLFQDRQQGSPQKAISTAKFSKEDFISRDNAYAWFGHSTILIRLGAKTIVADPVFDRASPVQFIGPRSFPMSNPPSIKDLPDEIDIILITHDHYDHLDYRTIKRIHGGVKNFIVPLGVKVHMLKWGVAAEKIAELDWYDSTAVEGLKVILTPTKHHSGRTATKRMSTLWGGWIIKSRTKTIYISGDGGYSPEFKKIGEKYGPFDLSFMENGAYNKAWSHSHMFPEESVMAGIDTKSQLVIPVHWGRYNLSVHPWAEPIARFSQEAIKKKLNFIVPPIGEIFTEDSVASHRWWEESL